MKKRVLRIIDNNYNVSKNWGFNSYAIYANVIVRILRKKCEQFFVWVLKEQHWGLTYEQGVSIYLPRLQWNVSGIKSL